MYMHVHMYMYLNNKQMIVAEGVKLLAEYLCTYMYMYRYVCM